MAIVDALTSINVRDLDLTRYVAVNSSDTVAGTVHTMRDALQACACVVDDEELVGIFTQRDVAARVVGRPKACEQPIRDEMSTSLQTMHADQSAADGLATMRQWWTRSVPVLDDDEHFVGLLSWYTMMQTIAGLLTLPTANEAGGPGVEHGLEFIDFTGLHTGTPVQVREADTADIAVHHMRARGIDSILVVDQREHVVGIVNEFDLLTKLACIQQGLADVPVGDIMTPNPVTLSVRSPIVDAIEQMAERGLSHATLLGESSRPVGVASFSDIVDYFEASLVSLG